MDKVLAGVTEIVHEMAGGLTGGEEAARAIMTTDTVPKQVALHHRDNWTVGGMAKGAGMLAPSLATMLCVITTDAVADAAALDHALRRASALTFDRLDVDGSCSTNDTVLLLASGASEIAPSQDELDEAVLRVCDDLCAQLQADAEGVTKRVVVTVTGAATEDDALTAARVVARDSLVKTALFGSDAELGPGAGRGRAWRRSGSTPSGSACRSTVLRSASTASARPAPATSTCPAPTSTSRSTSASATAAAAHPDHRPVARIRRRELGLQLMTASRRHDQGARARRGAAVAQAAARQDRRGQVRRQRDDRRRRSRPRSPPTWCSCATAASIPSSCTAAARRSARC